MAGLEGVVVKRSARARRMTLRVSRLDGKVTLTLPRQIRDRVAVDFLKEKAAWVAEAQQSVAPTEQVGIGSELMVEGRRVQVKAGLRRVAMLCDGIVEAPPAKTAAALKTCLEAEARKRCEEHVEHYAAKIGRSANRITMRDPRSRWGSCSSEGNLMFSWRLILAPPEVLDYVVAHEVAHLDQMNHSATFWNLVAELAPEYRRWKAWLGTDGPDLHRYRFD
ncbi:MAG: DUF45 domain-containing protein [Boseongicola sp.]|nr:MAG: DUF45 domain-containing protein [Boseongicola sp.]